MKNLSGDQTKVQAKRSGAGVLISAVLILTTAEVLSACIFKTKQPPGKSPQPTKTPSATPAPLSPTSTPDPTANWKTYSNQKYKFEIKYPQDWTSEIDTSVLEEGDLFSVTILGKTQKPQTEFYDGAQLTVGIPVKTDQDLKTWVQDNYSTENIHGEPNQFSIETIGQLTFQKVYTCGLGCFTYYNVKNNDLVYRIVAFAEGPDKAKYEQTLSKMLSSFKFLP